jgi:hypothetical protein
MKMIRRQRHDTRSVSRSWAGFMGHSGWLHAWSVCSFLSMPLHPGRHSIYQRSLSWTRLYPESAAWQRSLSVSLTDDPPPLRLGDRIRESIVEDNQ